jgi:Ca2+-binding EF-hand superfamily protein
LPGVLGERLFNVMDADDNGYLDQREFLTGLFRLYCSSFDEKSEFIFEIYDFDGDGFISKNDISTILASLPVINSNATSSPVAEGKFTQEGGGLDNFEQRVETLNDMNKILDACFEGRQRIDPTQFKRMNEDISSDTVLAVLGLFRERLPCSENFWRYKRNYDLHMKMMGQGNDGNEMQSMGGPMSDNGQSVMSQGSTMKRLASPKMRHVRVLSPYSRWQNDGSTGLQESKSFLS